MRPKKSGPFSPLVQILWGAMAPCPPSSYTPDPEVGITKALASDRGSKKREEKKPNREKSERSCQSRRW